MRGGYVSDGCSECSSARSGIVSVQWTHVGACRGFISQCGQPLGFIVKGPIKLSQFSNYSVEYTADVPVAEPKNNISLAMLIDEKQISFVANVYGTKEDFATATNAASLFQRELDKRGIQYKVFYGKRMYP
jgi:hypothetical protein